jgi:hypothetical protein
MALRNFPISLASLLALVRDMLINHHWLFKINSLAAKFTAASTARTFFVSTSELKIKSTGSYAFDTMSCASKKPVMLPPGAHTGVEFTISR